MSAPTADNTATAPFWSVFNGTCVGYKGLQSKSKYLRVHVFVGFVACKLGDIHYSAYAYSVPPAGGMW